MPPISCDSSGAKPFKTGFGYDSHRFMTIDERSATAPSDPDFSGTGPAGGIDCGADVLNASRSLLIGGVPASAEDRSRYGPFVARSDGDFVFHAAVNAVLSALGDPAARDIGAVFPNTDPSLSGADSAGFLAAASKMAWEKGYAIEEIKVTVKGAVRVNLTAAAENLKKSLGPAHQSCEILVQGTSGEGIGSIGRGEGMEAFAVCLLARRGLMDLLNGFLDHGLPGEGEARSAGPFAGR